MRRFSRGDLYFANLNPVVGSEQGGFRPVLILQNDVGNRFSSTVIVASVSSKPDKKRRLPTHCYIQEMEGLKHPSVVLLEQLRTIDKSRLKRFIGTMDADRMEEIDRALGVSVGLTKLSMCQYPKEVFKEDKYFDGRKNSTHESGNRTAAAG